MLDFLYLLVLTAGLLPSSEATQCDQFRFGQLCSLYPISAIVDLIPGIHNEQRCQDQCLFNVDCNNFTFVKLSDGKTDCFLLRECGSESSCADTQDCSFALSGPKTPSLIDACCGGFENKTCAKEFEIDHFYGVNEVEECQGLCQDTSGCHYWSLHGDVCFLYSKCGTPESCSSPCSSGPVFPDIDSCSPADDFFDTLVIGGTTSFESHSTSIELITTEQVCRPHMDELPEGRYSDAATLIGSMIFLCGGEGGDKSCLGLDLDQEEREWKLMASMVYFRVQVGMATIGDAVYASGGANETIHDSVEVFSAETGWRLEERLKMNRRRRGHCSVSIGSWLFIIGGLVEEQNTNSVEVFDTSLLEGDGPVQWINKTATIYERFLLGCQVAAFEGEEGIFAGGGKGRDEVWNTVEFYSVAEDTWRAIGSLNRARNSFAMSLVGQQVVVSGGLYHI